MVNNKSGNMLLLLGNKYCYWHTTMAVIFFECHQVIIFFHFKLFVNSINNWPIFVQAQCLRMVLLAVGRLIQCMWVTEWKDPLTICTLFGPFLIYQFLFHVLGGAKVTWNYSISSEGCFWNYSRGSGFFFQLTLGSDRLRFFLFSPSSFCVYLVCNISDTWAGVPSSCFILGNLQWGLSHRTFFWLIIIF